MGRGTGNAAVQFMPAVYALLTQVTRYGLVETASPGNVY